MAYLVPDRTNNYNGVTVNEYLLTRHNPNDIDMPSSKIVPTSITIHNTDWINVASATTPAEQYTRATVNDNLKDVRIHFYVDDKCAWQNLPLDLMSWHAGTNEGNRTSLSIECIMSPSYNNTDRKSEDNAARLAAYLLNKYGFGIDRLRTHKSWSGKQCPLYILPHWDVFVAKVKSYMNGSTSTTTSNIPAQDKLYRVRKSWDDSKSQIGAYRSLDSAKGICKEGYYVFDNDGKIVYPVASAPTKVEAPSKWTYKKDDDIVKLQQILNNKGAKLTVDGIAGDNTYNAVSKYTINFLDRGELTAWVQARLNKLGFDCGVADGIAGNRTIDGIKRFQLANKLGVGYLGGTDWYYLIR